MEAPSTRHYAALAVSILLNSATLILLKTVAVAKLPEDGRPDLGELIALGLSPGFVLAVALFLAGIYFWIIALRRLDLSLAYPSVSTSYALIALVSWWLFGERLGVWGWVGIVTIMAGVTLMFLPAGTTGARRAGRAE